MPRQSLEGRRSAGVTEGERSKALLRSDVNSMAGNQAEMKTSGARCDHALRLGRVGEGLTRADPIALECTKRRRPWRLRATYRAAVGVGGDRLQFHRNQRALVEDVLLCIVLCCKVNEPVSGAVESPPTPTKNSPGSNTCSASLL